MVSVTVSFCKVFEHLMMQSNVKYRIRKLEQFNRNHGNVRQDILEHMHRPPVEQVDDVFFSKSTGITTGKTGFLGLSIIRLTTKKPRLGWHGHR